MHKRWNTECLCLTSADSSIAAYIDMVTKKHKPLRFTNRRTRKNKIISKCGDNRKFYHNSVKSQLTKNVEVIMCIYLCLCACIYRHLCGKDLSTKKIPKCNN